MPLFSFTEAEKDFAAAESEGGRAFIFPSPLFLPVPPELILGRSLRNAKDVSLKMGSR